MWQTITGWPWSTWATIAAVFVAIWAAGSDMKERRLLLRQQAVIDVISESLAWNRAAVDLFTCVRTYKRSRSQADADELEGPALARFMAATTAMDRTLQTARMACPDFELRVWIAHAHKGIYDLLGTIQELPHVGGDVDTKLQRFIDDGLNYTNGFAAAMDEFGQRGSALYTVEGGLRYRLEQRSWNKKVAQEEIAQRSPNPNSEG